MSVLYKAGDLVKLRQICNCSHSRVNMFIKTLLTKALRTINNKRHICTYVGHKKVLYWHSLFLKKVI